MTSQGVQLATMRQLAQLLGDRATTGARSRRGLTPCRSSSPRSTGVDIHFIHVRSKQPNALPVIVTHGWPGSIIEQLKIIEPLTNPDGPRRKRGGRLRRRDPVAAGPRVFGQADRDRLGPDPHRARLDRADAAARLRRATWRKAATGATRSRSRWRCCEPPGLLGIHTNMPATIPDDIAKALAAGGPAPAGLSADEQYAWDQLDYFYKHGLGYARRWRTARRRSTRWRIRPSAWRPGCSTTTSRS